MTLGHNDAKIIIIMLRKYCREEKREKRKEPRGRKIFRTLLSDIDDSNISRFDSNKQVVFDQRNRFVYMYPR